MLYEILAVGPRNSRSLEGHGWVKVGWEGLCQVLAEFWRHLARPSNRWIPDEYHIVTHFRPAERQFSFFESYLGEWSSESSFGMTFWLEETSVQMPQREDESCSEFLFCRGATRRQGFCWEERGHRGRPAG